MENKLLRLIKNFDFGLQRCLKLPNRKDGIESPLYNPIDLSDTQNWASVLNDTVLIFDVSSSMRHKDCQPSRLEASKKAAETYIRRREILFLDDRVAIVTFNDLARVVLPLTELHRLNEILHQLRKITAAGWTDIAEGLKAAMNTFSKDLLDNPQLSRLRRILLLTDGRGGSPLKLANQLKNEGILIEVIGVGGDPSAVDEELLRKVATTDPYCFTHYCFFRDTNSLVAHYEDLATGIVFRRDEK